MENQSIKGIVDRFNNQGILTRNDYTFVEYVDELLKFQTESARLAFGQDDVEGIRINEVVARCEALAREKNLSNNQDVFEGLNAIKVINKEIAVAMSGKSGENRVAGMFQYVTRPDASFFRNVYICNEDDVFDETELDAVVLTKNGLVILEEKTAKDDITIAPDGRILFNNASCYHDISIGEKMKKKRRLLKKRIQKEFEKVGIDKEVVVDSLLVFSTPKGVRIRVHDQFRQENYCFRGSLFNRIDGFESDMVYTENELSALNQILTNIETEQKRFELKFDPEELKRSFAKAIVLLTYESQEEKNDQRVYDFETIQKAKEKARRNAIEIRKIRRVLTGTAAAAMCASVITLPGLGIASVGITSGVLAKAFR